MYVEPLLDSSINVTHFNIDESLIDMKQKIERHLLYWLFILFQNNILEIIIGENINSKRKIY